MDKIFSDIDFSFRSHPVTGDISTLNDEIAIKKSIENLILTNFYERKFQHQIGTPANALMFENYTPLVESNLRKSIIQVVENYEPRVVLDQVNVEYIESELAIYITIYFRIVNTLTPVTFNLILRRTR